MGHRGLITLVDNARTSRLKQLIERGTPVVLADRGSGWHNRCWVAVDDVFGGRLAAEHLIDRGHRQIAFVGGPMSIQQVADRHHGCSQVLAGIELNRWNGYPVRAP